MNQPSPSYSQLPIAAQLIYAPKVFYCGTTNSSPTTLYTVPDRENAGIRFWSCYVATANATVTLTVTNPAGTTVNFLSQAITAGSYVQFISAGTELWLQPGYVLGISWSTAGFPVLHNTISGLTAKAIS